MNTGGGTQYKPGLHDFSTQATALYDPATSRTNPGATALTGSDAGNMYLGVMNYGASVRTAATGTCAVERVCPVLAGQLQGVEPPDPEPGAAVGVWPAHSRQERRDRDGFSPDKHALVLGTDLDTMYRLGATLPSVVNRLERSGAKFMTYQEAGLPRSMMYDQLEELRAAARLRLPLQDGARPLVVRGGYRICYFPIPLRVLGGRMPAARRPCTAQYSTSLNAAAQSPDGIAN